MMTQPKTLVLIDSLYEQYGLDGAERDGILFLPMLKGQWTGRAIRALFSFTNVRLCLSRR